MLNAANNLSGQLAIDGKSVGDLRQAARQNSPEALKATARQFEALFMNMVMKSMRDATPQDGVFDNQQSRMFTSMLDQQLSQSMASRGVGLADVLIRQLSNTVGKPAADAAGAPATAVPARNGVAALPPRPNPMLAPVANSSQPPHVQAFLSRLGPEAEEASRSTGIPAKFMLGQAALESGWGKRQITAADGTPSHNLFGIKASGNWNGRVVEATTTEYVNGVPQKRVEKFRAYDSYADSFRDYARLLRNNPRYENVLANAQDVKGFAQGLQNAGYATDPDYAAKLTRVIAQTSAGSARASGG
ncbi:MAG TPA: flagellar assembly peptidoglycan hydrolase FlgJ [Burkholderiaceae bacterium]|nr:flagellar assembly peptidoglycan hydrolase FlgJ [Burkholderiaceae bacterium]